ncbi:MAG: squalene--hopene cyclase [Alphaproteobacteria bacterium]
MTQLQEQPYSETVATGDASEDSFDVRIDRVIEDAREALKALQSVEGYWRFDLEADATIPAEFILLQHFLDEIDPHVETRLAAYIRDLQGTHGGWPLFYDGDFNISCSVKAYFALKLAGDSPDVPHMQRAREAILAHGGAARANVFTRIALALYSQVPWRAVPVMPVEIMLLPRWFPFHLSKVSYWSRTVIVPLLILMAFRPRARNPRSVDIRELFTTPPERERNYFANRGPVATAFLAIDRVLRLVEPLFPSGHRRRAIDAAERFVLERLNGEHGLGGIFPAMANTLMAFDCLGYGRDDPHRKIAKQAVDNLLSLKNGQGFCQPCLSPVWDTCLASQALMEAGEPPDSPAVKSALDWMKGEQILDVAGDWAERRPDLRPGGWAFEFANPHYPDIDDSAAVLMAIERAASPDYAETIDRGVEWIEGMQSENGGWGSFDVDNTYFYLNHIPFADHGALLDPPTADVTARCVGMLCQCGYDRDHPAVARGLAYLKREQEADGSWFGRWGTNYIYGTWSVLSTFNVADEDPNEPHIRRAVDWLKRRQQPDGGWGEDGASYWSDKRNLVKASTPSQTAWALLGLMAAGEVNSEAVRRGIAFLTEARRSGANWEEKEYTAVGFPRVFYLKYHGYSAYFPLWALARYRNLRRGNRRTTAYGM